MINAALAGNIVHVRKLLSDGGVGVNDVLQEGGWTALLAAAQEGHVALVKMLIKAGAKVDKANDDGCTPLYMAAQNGRMGAVKVLIKAKAKVNRAANNGCTSLYMAAQDGNLGIVKALIKAKAKVNQPQKQGKTPLYQASQNAHVEVAKALIEAGAAVDKAKKDGCTPIWMASQEGNTSVVQVLIDAGARTAEPMFSGQSPLHVAARHGKLECVKLLVGFRPNTPGWTTFLAGATSKKELEAYHSPPANRPPTYLPKIFDRAYLEPIWKFQQERYSDLHLKGGSRGETALEMADRYKKTDVAKLLRGMMVLPKDGAAVDEKKKATKGGKE